MTAAEAVALYQTAVRDRQEVRAAYSEALRRLELANNRVEHALSMVARAKLPKSLQRQSADTTRKDTGK